MVQVTACITLLVAVREKDMREMIRAVSEGDAIFIINRSEL